MTNQPQEPSIALPPKHGNVPVYDVARALTVVAGDTKTGKTTFAASAGDQMLILDFEDSTRFVSGCQSIQVDSQAQLLEILERLELGDHPYKLVAVDSVTALIHLIENETLEGFKKVPRKRGKPPLHTLADVDFGAGYARSSNKLYRIINRFHQLQRLGIGVLLICHTEIRMQVTGGQEQAKEVPNLHPKHYQNTVLGKADAVLHLRREVEPDDTVTHTLYTQPDIFSSGIGCRFPNLPAEIEPTWDAYAGAVKEATADLKANLEAEAKARAKAAREAKAKTKAKAKAQPKVAEDVHWIDNIEGSTVPLLLTLGENGEHLHVRDATPEDVKRYGKNPVPTSNQPIATQPNKENK